MTIIVVGTDSSKPSVTVKSAEKLRKADHLMLTTHLMLQLIFSFSRVQHVTQHTHCALALLFNDIRQVLLLIAAATVSRMNLFMFPAPNDAVNAVESFLRNK